MRVATLAAFLLVTSATADVHFVTHNETRVLAAEGMCRTPDWHFDYPGNTITSFKVPTYEACCDACEGIPYCGAYTWTNAEGGTCFVKFMRGKSEWKGARPDGSANYISAEVYQCGAVTKEVDFVGTDLSNHPLPRAQDCCTLCQYYPLCFGFSWSDYNGGTCWLKGEGLKAVNAPGVYSAYKARLLLTTPLSV